MKQKLTKIFEQHGGRELDTAFQSPVQNEYCMYIKRSQMFTNNKAYKNMEADDQAS